MANSKRDDNATLGMGTRIVIPVRIAIALVISLVFGTVSYTIYAYSCYRALLDAVREGDRYNWTLHDQREWADEVHAHNPTVWVPDPNAIFWNRRAHANAAPPKSNDPFATMGEP